MKYMIDWYSNIQYIWYMIFMFTGVLPGIYDIVYVYVCIYVIYVKWTCIKLFIQYSQYEMAVDL